MDNATFSKCVGGVQLRTLWYTTKAVGGYEYGSMMPFVHHSAEIRLPNSGRWDSRWPW